MNQKIDWPSFIASVVILLAACLPLVVAPETGGRLLVEAYNLLTAKLGWLYMLAGLAVLILLAWLAFGPYGKVRLAASEEDRPEFSTLSWVAMLFCAGVGAGLLAWAPIEWAYYYGAPPHGAEPYSARAAEWASTYGLFHWGPTAWAIYCLPTLAIAYPYYAKRIPYLRLSTSCHYFFGGERRGKAERLIDWLFMIGLLGGAGTSLGFSTPMIAACLAGITGSEADFALEMTIVVVSVIGFGVSVWLGLRKGIKRLSDFNMFLAFLLLAFVLIVGPTVFLLKTSVNSLGLMVQEFLRMNTWTDPFTDSGFVESWTVFYWAWWAAFAPFVGLFVTRISRGRTIRQVIFGMLGWGSLGGALFYMILGNYALSLELDGVLQVTRLMGEQGSAPTIVAILSQLPASSLVLAAFAIIGLVFSITTYDSASYILASVATRRLPAGEDPERWHRVFWAIALAFLPLTLMFIGGDSGLRVIQSATLVVSLPLLGVGVLMAFALVRQLRSDFG